MDKTNLLEIQIQKLNEVIAALSDNFQQDEFIDEISFLSIVRDNLIEQKDN